ncbi:SURF1 family protein [Sphingorhabdus soli]|uniref:SURF1-like protein n=1 Tax=Flavisphingopyxis soli TaxID=2601267 RepID=A0A5C6UMZ5_9SPHN|nr:SURF1 family cytochrome oxidase biogenesis protein [Sphingorhabdus soli]TXC73900.1 SURF1 family protein [Sphingorhabdus soli]
MSDSLDKPRRPIPIVATIVVALAVAAMIALGIWQYQRAGEKERLLALYERNIAMDSDVMFPALGPVPDSALFRRSSLVCLNVVGWRSEGGRAPGGGGTTRYIADCRTGAEGPGASVQVGTSDEPNLKQLWNGGAVHGWISTAPDHRGLIDRIQGAAPPRAMLVMTDPVAGLKPNAAPDLGAIPNNHIAYMWQWFFFATIALAIYGIALRQRWTKADAAPATD